MLKINQTIIVEGKYDKIKLSSFIDANFIITNGFGIFKDAEQKNYIKLMAKKNGIIILTDSDNAGFMIRAHIQNIVEEKYITHVYVPDILGKEKRKASYSSEGKLGVEGISKDIIIYSLDRAGVFNAEVKKELSPITNIHLYEDNIIGGDNSLQKRKELLKLLNFPSNMSSKQLIKAINSLMNYEEYKILINKL